MADSFAERPVGILIGVGISMWIIGGWKGSVLRDSRCLGCNCVLGTLGLFALGAPVAARQIELVCLRVDWNSMAGRLKRPAGDQRPPRFGRERLQGMMLHDEYRELWAWLSVSIAADFSLTVLPVLHPRLAPFILFCLPVPWGGGCG